MGASDTRDPTLAPGEVVEVSSSERLGYITVDFVDDSGTACELTLNQPQAIALVLGLVGSIARLRRWETLA
jgi:hypothetical protein